MLQVHEPTQRPSARIRGYIFWLTADGKHGLVAETQDQVSPLGMELNILTARKSVYNWRQLYRLGYQILRS
jgi:hypothetical protein